MNNNINKLKELTMALRQLKEMGENDVKGVSYSLNGNILVDYKDNTQKEFSPDLTIDELIMQI